VVDLHSPLRINVGFFIVQTIGYTREFDIDLPQVCLEPDLNLYEMQGTVRITRTPQGLLVQTRLNAVVPAECVRCLEGFNQPLSVDFSELYAFNKKSMTESGLILPEDGHINLGPLVREFMLLEVPISPLCRVDCKGLCPECGHNLNINNCEHTHFTDNHSINVLKAQS
jgi:uncharacterized protein